MNNILTVTQLNYSVRHLLETELGQIWLTGEISNFSQPVSGHWYLTLKDENACSVKKWNLIECSGFLQRD